MKKNFKIGDKVKFLRSNDYGTIRSIISERKVQVEEHKAYSMAIRKIYISS